MYSYTFILLLCNIEENLTYTFNKSTLKCTTLGGRMLTRWNSNNTDKSNGNGMKKKIEEECKLYIYIYIQPLFTTFFLPLLCLNRTPLVLSSACYHSDCYIIEARSWKSLPLQRVPMNVFELRGCAILLYTDLFASTTRKIHLFLYQWEIEEHNTSLSIYGYFQ